jgi:GT2 family glycosyltransferase
VSRAGLLLLLPLVLLYGLLLFLLVSCWDLLSWPWVASRRRRAPSPDAGPRACNASILILNWNGRHFLEALLPSVRVAVERCPGNHEVIVIDNGSTDDSVGLLAERFPWARLVRLPENRFFIRGNRAGVEAATRDILVFLNNDMRVEPDFLVELLAPFGPPDLFAVTARIAMDAEHKVETGRTRLQFRSGAFHALQSDGPEAPLIPAMWAGGGSSAFDRRKYAELGGFEDLYDPFYVEDMSLSYQAWRRGWRVVFAPKALVHHVHRGTSARAFGKGFVERMDRRNRELFFWRAVTDLRMCAAHALLLSWNVLKEARGVGGALLLRALLAAVPRLHRALLSRARLRAVARRSDREVLALANHVSRHRRAVGGRKNGRVLSVGTTLAASGHTLALTPAGEPPVQDLFGLLPRRFWATAGDAVARDALRDLLREEDYDAVHFRDPLALALAGPELDGVTATVSLGEAPAELPLLERAREARMRSLLGHRAQAVEAAP